MKNHPLLMILSFIFFTSCLSTIIVENTYADDYWGSGGTSTTPEGCDPNGTNQSYKNNPKDRYNCCFEYSCPHWVLISTSEFNEIANNRSSRTSGSYTDLGVCKDGSSGVVISGKSWNGKYYLHNIYPETVHPFKTQHAGQEAQQSLNATVGTRGITYGDLLQLVIQQSGKSEAELAFFCEGMLSNVPEGPEEPDDPDDPNPPSHPACNNTTTVNVEQRNSSNSKVYNAWTSNKIYAKPTDKISYSYSYCAGVQSQASDLVTTSHGSEGCSNTSNTNTQFSSAITWDNYYNISQPSTSWKKTFSIGDVTSTTDKGNYTIQSKDVGNILNSTITSSTPISAWSRNDGIHTWSLTCLYTCACGCTGEGCVDQYNCACKTESHSHTNDYYAYSYNNGPASDSVEVRIPYNYIIGNGSVIIEDNDYVYAGETIKLESASFDVLAKYSDVLQETYSTRTQAASATLYALWFADGDTYSGGNERINSNFCTYYRRNNEQCKSIDRYTAGSGFNESSSLSGAHEEIFQGTYSVFDIPAGYKMCLGFEVSLAESSNNPDRDNSNGKKYISTIKCRIVAKKPTFQVWGGSIFLNGKTNLSMMSKTNLYSYYAYRGADKGIVRYYGSWGELGVMAVDGVDVGNLASGAAAGYTDNNNGTLVSNPGGSSAVISELTHLTIPNTSGGTASTKDAESTIKTNIITTYIESKAAKQVSGSVNLADGNMYTSVQTQNNIKEVRRTHSMNNISVTSSAELPRNTTHIISSDGNINIDSNLIYDQTYYISSSQIPQYIIYAKNDINIRCNVSEINAILVADGNIETCYDGGGEDDRARSNQLVIKGALISKTLNLGRTYGAGTGKDSVIPAEIIDADPTVYLWGMSEATETPTLTTTYAHELSPRY